MKTSVNQIVTRFFVFALFCSVITLSGCKNNDVAPALADQVTGSYTVSSMSQKGLTITLPTNGISGEYTVKKLSDDKVNVSFVLKVTGSADETGQEDAELKKAADGSIEFYLAGQKAGSFSNNTINFMFDDPDGTLTIVAKKK
ncbi:hypothetical protein [Runella sp.]|uniref:hypothetical protein n=1 Tax=Runella sp. TaxID=1960881 RepID=UPI003D0B1775